jgi:predicted AAA+ superfamily ATPase
LEENVIYKNRILKDYFDLIFYKDIVDRYNLKSIKSLKIFRKNIVSYMSQICSYNKLSNEIWVDYKTFINWIWYFIDSYFLFEVKNFSFSVWKIEWSLSKIYLLDNWFYSINFWNYKEDYWNLFENIVFLEIRKRWLIENENIFYFKDKEFDIDFIIYKEKKAIPIQVCYELNEKNIDREVIKFDKFLNKYNIEKWYLVLYENYKKEFQNEKIEIIGLVDISNILKF